MNHPPESTSVSGPLSEAWLFRLYLAGQTRNSLAALANLKQICETYLTAPYQIEVVNLFEYPHLARSDQVVAIPTLVRLQPHPSKKIIGNLSDVERVLAGLDLPQVIGQLHGASLD